MLEKYDRTLASVAVECFAMYDCFPMRQCITTLQIIAKIQDIDFLLFISLTLSLNPQIITLGWKSYFLSICLVRHQNKLFGTLWVFVADRMLACEELRLMQQWNTPFSCVAVSGGNQESRIVDLIWCDWSIIIPSPLWTALIFKYFITFPSCVMIGINCFMCTQRHGKIWLFEHEQIKRAADVTTMIISSSYK